MKELILIVILIFLSSSCFASWYYGKGAPAGPSGDTMLWDATTDALIWEALIGDKLQWDVSGDIIWWDASGDATLWEPPAEDKVLWEN